MPIKETALYAQDTLTLHQWTINVGLRRDCMTESAGPSSSNRGSGAAYTIKPTNTVFRFSYGRFLETPFNENLVLSSATGAGGLATNVFGAFAGAPLQSGGGISSTRDSSRPSARWVVVYRLLLQAHAQRI